MKTGNLIFLLILATVIGSSSARAQQHSPQQPPSEDDEVVRVSTTLVTVPVSVLDRQGRFLPDLRRENFRIFEDHDEQEVAFFETADKPFTVALMLDTSDSTQFKLQEIQDAALAFINQLRPVDRVIIVAFDKRVTILNEPTSDRKILQAAIRRARTGGGTSLYGALETTISQQLKRIRGRKAIVLFTDGVDTTSVGATYQNTLDLASELDALIYTIQYETYSDAMRNSQQSAGLMTAQVVTSKGEYLSVAYERGHRYLTRMSDLTGGRFFYAQSAEHLTESFARIAEELRRQYSIGYYPQRQAENVATRHIRVRVNVPGAAVRARRSYVLRPSRTGNN